VTVSLGGAVDATAMFEKAWAKSRSGPAESSWVDGKRYDANHPNTLVFTGAQGGIAAG